MFYIIRLIYICNFSRLTFVSCVIHRRLSSTNIIIYIYNKQTAMLTFVEQHVRKFLVSIFDKSKKKKINHKNKLVLFVYWKNTFLGIERRFRWLCYYYYYKRNSYNVSSIIFSFVSRTTVSCLIKNSKFMALFQTIIIIMDKK